MTRTENPALAVLPLFTGMHLLGWSEGGSAGNLALAPHPVKLPVASLSWVDANGNKLRGDGSVDDRLVPPPAQ
ncbi:hypothetical protein KAM369_26820 [Aeromonas caviae]|nr:hypothetical protein KAM369_26820 [Aeromonas caviae]